MTETTTMPSRKNIYIRDEDQDLLREFEASGGNASELFSQALSEHIDLKRTRKWRERTIAAAVAKCLHTGRPEEIKCTVDGMVDYDDILEKPVTKVWEGIWLALPEEYLDWTLEDETRPFHGIILTKEKKLIVVEGIGEPPSDDNDLKLWACWEFSSLDDLWKSESSPRPVFNDALDSLGLNRDLFEAERGAPQDITASPST